jgi:hypothetical protein
LPWCDGPTPKVNVCALGPNLQKNLKCSCREKKLTRDPNLGGCSFCQSPDQSVHHFDFCRRKSDGHYCQRKSDYCSRRNPLVVFPFGKGDSSFLPLSSVTFASSKGDPHFYLRQKTAINRLVTFAELWCWWPSFLLVNIMFT